MNAYVSLITLGVEDMDRARTFYSDGLGWPVRQDHPTWVAFGTAEGSTAIGLFPRDALATEAGGSADRSGFAGVALSYIVRSEDRVDAVLAEAEDAGARIVRPAGRAEWGGYFGYFADPDGHLWRVAAGAGDQAYAE